MFLTELSRVRPVIFYLDDIHWADASTIDLLSYLANDITTMRALVLLTFRPADLEFRKHPFKQTKLDLESRAPSGMPSYENEAKKNSPMERSATDTNSYMDSIRI